METGEISSELSLSTTYEAGRCGLMVSRVRPVSHVPAPGIMSWRNGTDQPRGTGQLPGHCPVIQDTPEDRGGNSFSKTISISV